MQTTEQNLIFKTRLRKLVSDSNAHAGFRVLIAMAITFIPALNLNLDPVFNQALLPISIYLCLGVMASAIVETDDNYKGRGIFNITIVVCFFIASTSVELLMPYPFMFAFGLLISCFVFMMLAIFGTHYNKVGFGAILIAIYTMIGYEQETAWYIQPLCLSLGALWYGLFSILWNYYSPYRSLREQLAQLFFSISRYQEQKAALFNTAQCSSKEEILQVRQQLALQNISVMARLEACKRIIQSRFMISHKQNDLNKLNNLYFIAEQIHERISASQYLYSQLESHFGKSQILEGYHQLLLQLSEDCYQIGVSINDKTVYQHSARLKWNVRALSDQLILLKQKENLAFKNSEAMLALDAVFDNISGINALLIEVFNIQSNKDKQLPVIPIDLAPQTKLPILKKLSNAIESNNPVFQHSVRISVCLSVAYILQQMLSLPHGFWVLQTVLFVCQPSFSDTRKRLMQRTVGTLLGIILGYPIIMLVEGTFIQVIFLIFSAFWFFNYLRTNYGLAVIFITLFVMFLFNLLTGTGFEILPARIGETLIGCALSLIAITFIFPNWQFLRFPKLVSNVLTFSGRYFNQVSDQYEYGRSENLNYRITRFETFTADAMLTSAWQNMLIEPNSKQKLTKEIYALVNRCDALVSYIAALASHRHKIEGYKDNELLQELISITSLQVINANKTDQLDTIQISDTIEKFEIKKAQLTGETLLIVEQLRLIAFTALDIQLLSQKLNLDTKSE